METLILLMLVGIHGAAGRTHALKYFYTASSQVPNFPEFVSVGYVDDVPIDHYDSNTKRTEPKQDWMEKTTDQQYWERETQLSLNTQQSFKNNIEILNQRFNQTGGVHMVQMMYGCEWDDETGEVKGFDQQGFDGEDFISLDLTTETWVAPSPQAFNTKMRWDKDKADLSYLKNYYTEVCPDWLKKYLEHGRSSLLRTELPSVSLLQKSPSSPVTCHATGFYPDRASLFWTRDGEELHEDVDLGEILPNHDGTFQTSADLKVSSIPPEDWDKYHCVFQLSGVKKDISTRLDVQVIRSNRAKPMDMTTVGIVIAAVVVLIAVIAAIGFFVYRQKKAKRPPTPVKDAEVLQQLQAPPSDTSSEHD